MNTDILIPLGSKSHYGNIELRYCLRSIEKHLSGVGNVFIVGELPGFVTNVIHIPFEESKKNTDRAFNIYSKIMAGINYQQPGTIGFIWGKELTKTLHPKDSGLSENFLFMNDDHFLLSDFEASEFPYFHRGLIETHRMPNEAQRIQYENTVRFASRTLDYGVHCPMIYNKKKFKLLFDGLMLWPDYGFEIKSRYANFFISKANQTECTDLKFKEVITKKESIYQALKGREWFSVGDACLKNGVMQEVLQDLFPSKSKFEL